MLKADVSVLKTDVSVLQKDICELKIDVSVLKTDVSVLKTDVSQLKQDVSLLQLDVGVIKSNYATKEDILGLDLKIEGLRSELYKAISAQTYWFVSALFGLLVTGLGLAKILF
ncbi:CCDC90 family protein [Erwiniaceae bacterium CMYE1]|nr:CCDC90 family protein [Erwinia phyllosphaerae]